MFKIENCWGLVPAIFNVERVTINITVPDARDKKAPVKLWVVHDVLPSPEESV